MPRCFVERCHNYGGKRLNIILHSFPNNLEKIKTWLRCIERSGHVVRDIEELAERIFEGKTNNRFRVCSEHFSPQSYQPSGLRKTLRKDAVPTIFRDVPPQKCPWQKVKPACKSIQCVVTAGEGSHEAGALLQHSHHNASDPVGINLSGPAHHPCDVANMETTIKATENFRQDTKETKEDCSLGTKRMGVTHMILELTLEIICLLTGEDYFLAKKTSSYGEGWSKIQSPFMEPRLDSLIHAKSKQQKILELANKIIELLTGEKCEYLEDDEKGVRMESQWALASLDDMVNGLSERILEESLCEKKAEDLTLTDCQHQYQFSNIKVESISCDERNLTDPNTYAFTDETQNYPSTPIKEEPTSCDEENFTEPEINAPTDHIQQHASPAIKEESFSSESGNLTDPNIYTPTDHTQQYSSLKGEFITCDDGNLTEFNLYTPTEQVDHYSPAGMEELSCDGGNLTKPTDPAQQHASNPVIAETVLCDKGRALSTDIYPKGQKSLTHIECENEDAQNSLFDKGNLDTDIYALIKHAQAKYTFTRIEDGSSSEEEENSKDTDPHTPAERTQPRPTNGTGEAVLQTFQCPDCSECFIRKSGLINHRRNHRQEKLTCSKCGKVFSKRSSLQNHLTLHTGEKPYACPICGKCFARKSNLISHETIHSGKASFICAECGRYFVCKVHLTKHQIIHEK